LCALSVPPIWFVSKWWHKPQYPTFLGAGITPAAVDEALEQVAVVFDTKWMKEDQRGHPIWNSLLVPGCPSLETLFELGRDLVTVTGTLRLPSVVDDLKHKSQFHSARFELGLAAQLRRCGHDMEFRPPLPNGKNSDFIARLSGQNTFFEAKRLSQSEASQSLTQLSLALMTQMSTLTRPPDCSNYEIELAESLTSLLGSGAENDNVTIEAAVTRIVTEVQKRLPIESPIDITIERLARVRLGTFKHSSLTGPIIRPETELRRIITKRHLKNAVDQLAVDAPGIIAFQTMATLEASATQMFVEQWLSTQGPGAEHVTAVLFLPVYTARPR
jgi:hypothetical protein